MDIKVKWVQVYGDWKAYPVDFNAKTLAKIAGTTTLTKQVLEAWHDMGGTVTIVAVGQDGKEVAA